MFVWSALTSKIHTHTHTFSIFPLCILAATHAQTKCHRGMRIRGAIHKNGSVTTEHTQCVFTHSYMLCILYGCCYLLLSYRFLKKSSFCGLNIKLKMDLPNLVSYWGILFVECVCVCGMVRVSECVMQLTGLSEKQGTGPCSCSCPLSVCSLMGREMAFTSTPTAICVHKHTHTQRLVLHCCLNTTWRSAEGHIACIGRAGLFIAMHYTQLVLQYQKSLLHWTTAHSIFMWVTSLYVPEQLVA